MPVRGDAIAGVTRLVLGTAQLGSPYGIANVTGKPDMQEARNLVRLAWDAGLREFDTAQGYGESERRLGTILRELGIADRCRVISKLHPALDHRDPDAVHRAVEKSLADLGVSELFGLLLHSEDILDTWDDGVGAILRGTVKKGMVRNLGVSVYAPRRALEALSKEDVTIVQVPANLLDRRFEDAGVFDTADRAGKRIYIRSVFLQGLLLMPRAALPDRMLFAAGILDRVRRLADRVELEMAPMALGYVAARYPRARVIFGAETATQVAENLAWWGQPLPEQHLRQIIESMGDVPEAIINPALWPPAK